MTPRARLDSARHLTRVLGLLLGGLFVILRVAIATMKSLPGADALQELSLALLIGSVVSLSGWMTLAWLCQRERQRQRAVRSVGSTRRGRASTMQSQWKQDDPGAVWATTHHDTRERIDRSERNSQVSWWTDNSMQPNSLQSNSLQANSIQQTTTTRMSAPDTRDPVAPICWTLELLQELEWFRFEQVAAGFFRSIGLDARPLGQGPDHNINLDIYQPGDRALHAIAQTRNGAAVIGIDPIRALYGVMQQAGVRQAFFVTGGRFTSQATEAARGVGVFLIDGAAMLARIVSLAPERQEELLQLAVEGDYRSPTCPVCKRKMALRSGDFKSFWRCLGYPECKTRMVLQPPAATS
ncbi:MAG: restriction endonuclease [Pseudomonadota bacterium]|nr:restriction endonuclease [Pseudomonadota bacterium]